MHQSSRRARYEHIRITSYFPFIQIDTIFILHLRAMSYYLSIIIGIKVELEVSREFVSLNPTSQSSVKRPFVESESMQLQATWKVNGGTQFGVQSLATPVDRRVLLTGSTSTSANGSESEGESESENGSTSASTTNSTDSEVVGDKDNDTNNNTNSIHETVAPMVTTSLVDSTEKLIQATAELEKTLVDSAAPNKRPKIAVSELQVQIYD